MMRLSVVALDIAKAAPSPAARSEAAPLEAAAAACGSADAPPAPITEMVVPVTSASVSADVPSGVLRCDMVPAVVLEVAGTVLTSTRFAAPELYCQ